MKKAMRAGLGAGVMVVAMGCGGGSGANDAAASPTPTANPSGPVLVNYSVKGDTVSCSTADRILTGFNSVTCEWDAARWQGQTCAVTINFVLADPALLHSASASNCSS